MLQNPRNDFVGFDILECLLARSELEGKRQTPAAGLDLITLVDVEQLNGPNEFGLDGLHLLDEQCRGNFFGHDKGQIPLDWREPRQRLEVARRRQSRRQHSEIELKNNQAFYRAFYELLDAS